MSYNPITPSKSASRGPAPVYSLSSKSAKSHSLLDPSPASTYGDTQSANSVPATPADGTEYSRQPPYMQRVYTREEKLECIKNEIKKRSPTKVNNGAFIVQSRLSGNDDPFVSNSTPVTTPLKNGDAINNNPAVTPVGRAEKQNGTAGATATSATNNQATTTIDPPDSSVPAPLFPYETPTPSADNAQAIYSPDACLFVANLPNSAADAQLLASVEKIFSQYGKCFIKIRRDSRGMPYAFVQFTDKRHAVNACTFGKNQVIEGRKCRTEMAKARRSVYVTRHDGKPIDVAAVRRILMAYGDLDQIHAPSPTEAHNMGLAVGGAFFQFKYFQSCQDAVGELRTHAIFRFEVNDMMDRDNNTRTRPGLFVPVIPMHAFTPHALANDPVTPAPINADESIEIVNLPPSMHVGDVVQIFGDYGQIYKVVITYMLPVQTNEGAYDVRATIQYGDSISVANAVKAEDMRTVKGGYKIRVFPRNPTLAAMMESSTSSMPPATAWPTPNTVHAEGQGALQYQPVWQSMQAYPFTQTPTVASNSATSPAAVQMNAQYMPAVVHPGNFASAHFAAQTNYPYLTPAMTTGAVQHHLQGYYGNVAYSALPQSRSG